MSKRHDDPVSAGSGHRVLAAGMVGLGFWQLNVYHRQGDAAAARRAEAPPIPLSSVARPGTSATDGFGRSVSFEGSYDPALQLLVPAEDGTRQFRVLTGLRQADGSVVAVVRGVVPDPTAPPPPSGQVQQVGVLLPTEEHLTDADLPDGQIASPLLTRPAKAWHRRSCSCPSRRVGFAMARTSGSGGYLPRSLYSWLFGWQETSEYERQRWQGSQQSPPPSRHRLRPMRNAWIRYRIMAWIVGTLLVILVCVGLPLKYIGGDDTVVLWTAIPHGYLYMLLLITAVDLGLRAKWSWTRLLLIALAGTVPFLSFVAERSATKDIRKKLAAQAEAVAPAPTSS